MTELRFPQRASQKLVLASASAARASLLRNAGLTFDIEPAGLNEAAIRDAIEEELEADDVAELLARAKAESVSAHSSALVIGADQTLDLNGAIFNKPQNMEEARRQLLALSGKTHTLHSAVALARHGETVWADTQQARMTMRHLEPAYVVRYLAAGGPAALESVGTYRLESIGVQLFERIEGDFFTILGLPLLPLLSALRREGAIEA